MLKRMWPYMSRYKKYLAISCFCVVAETVFELIIPSIMADIIDIGVANADKDYILIKGAQMIACALIALVLGILYARYAATAGQGFGAELRKDEFAKVQSFSFANTDHFSTSSLITRRSSSDRTIPCYAADRTGADLHHQCPACRRLFDCDSRFRNSAVCNRAKGGAAVSADAGIHR